MKKAIICSQSDFTTDYRIHKMARTLTVAGYEVSFLGRRHPHHTKEQGERTHLMKLLFYKSALFYAEFNIRLFLYLLFHKRVDLVVSIDLDTLLGCVVGTGMKRERLMFDSHEYFPEVPEIARKRVIKWAWRKIQDICVPKVDICVTVCESIADIFYERYGRRFIVVRNVPLTERAKQVAARSEYRKSGNEPFTILYQGAVNIGRGLEEMIMAMKSLEGCRLVVVGDGAIMEEVKELVRAEGVGDRVSFEGRKPFDELAVYMARADVGIVFTKDMCLSYHLSLPNRIFDFIQACLPIVCNRLPEVERIVEGSKVGHCIESITVPEIVEAIRTCMRNPDLLAEWKTNARRLRDSLTWEIEARKLRTVLEQTK